MPNPKIRDLTLSRFLDAVASDEPVPGGGAVAAVAGAVGSALLQMVISLALRRAKDPGAVSCLTSLHGRADALRLRFLDLADDDVAAYRAVGEALALPRSTSAEKADRSAALQRALVGAAAIPLATAKLAADALALASEVAPLCPQVARSDLVTAVQLAGAAAEAALANVDANALSLGESTFRHELARSRTELATAVRTRTVALLEPLERGLTEWLPPGTAPSQNGPPRAS
ncbi:cyclodeaminase/cyclohydrolase family protein [Candidatus Bipolaricaulota bacterium]|nr:cyclodeaminase/cyclohydrolase family protein [Candidatus Bipolaricaulota bacterium]